MAALIDPNPMTVDVTIAPNRPIEVEVVRRKTTAQEFGGLLVEAFIGVSLTAWLAMLLIPAAFGTAEFGFFRVVAVILVIRFILPTNGSYRFWTRELKSKK